MKSIKSLTAAQNNDERAKTNITTAPKPLKRISTKQ